MLPYKCKPHSFFSIEIGVGRDTPLGGLRSNRPAAQYNDSLLRCQHFAFFVRYFTSYYVEHYNPFPGVTVLMSRCWSWRSSPIALCEGSCDLFWGSTPIGCLRQDYTVLVSTVTAKLCFLQQTGFSLPWRG